MEWIWIVLSVLVILASTYFRTERMTNKAVAKTHGEQAPSELPLYGPNATAPPPEPSGTSPSSKGSGSSGGTYPMIYGPDAILAPGTKPPSGKTSSDDTSDPTYEFNPDLKKAFPTEGPPQPFLTDFSKFQK